MRIHIGVAMARGGRYSQTAIVATEHQLVTPAPNAPAGTRPERQFIVRAMIQSGPAIETARDTLVQMVTEAQRYKPCVFVDAGVGGGRALYDALRIAKRRGEYPGQFLHSPHGYIDVGRDRQYLLDAILSAYATDALLFQEDVALRPELAKALAARNATVKDDGIISTSSDEALVTALGLSLRYAFHGHPPAVVTPEGTTAPDIITGPRIR